jgi:hypothetical protein
VTDARMPERWLNDRRLLRLSGDGWRLHMTAIMWSVANRTDGVLDDADLALVPGVDPGRTAELVKVGLWLHRQDRWIIRDFYDTQTSSSELAILENLRRREREKKARQRARKAGAVPGDGPRDGDAEGTGMSPPVSPQLQGDTPPRKERSTTGTRRSESRVPGDLSRGRSRGTAPGQARPGQGLPDVAPKSEVGRGSGQAIDPGWPEVTSPPDSGDGDQAGCIGNGCPRQARRSCRTCWDHRDLEPAR